MGIGEWTFPIASLRNANSESNRCPGRLLLYPHWLQAVSSVCAVHKYHHEQRLFAALHVGHCALWNETVRVASHLRFVFRSPNHSGSLRYICFGASLPVSCGLKNRPYTPFLAMNPVNQINTTVCCLSPKERQESSPAENELRRVVAVVPRPNKSETLECVDGPVCACG